MNVGEVFMRQRSGLATVRVVLILLSAAFLVLLAAGCSGGLTSGETGTSSSNVDNKSLEKAGKELQSKLEIQLISVYPSQAGLARVYASIANRSDSELELVKIVLTDNAQKRYADKVVTDLKPGESKTFEMQTAVVISEAEGMSFKIDGVKVKDKP